MASQRSNRLVRVFIDASVLFAAALSARGYARDLLLAGFSDRLALWVSNFVIEEGERNLAAKAPAALTVFLEIRPLLSRNTSNPSTSLVRRAGTVVELKDAPVVAGAVRARASFLATYDRRHLLSHAEEIESAFGIAVVTPEAVLRAIGELGGHQEPGNGAAPK